MPKLPQYDSQRALTTRQPAALRTGAGEANVYDVTAEAAGRAQDIAVKWSNAVDTIQTTNASANMKSGLLDIFNRAEQEIDYNAGENYVKEVQKLKEESLKGFTNPAARKNAALAFDYEAQAATIKIQNFFKKKIIEAGQVAALRLIDLEISNYMSAPDDKAKAQTASAIRSIVDAQIQAGIFGPKQGEKVYKYAISEAQELIKDEEDLRKKQEKEIRLAQDIAKNEREDELVQLRVNMADAAGNPLDPAILIEMARDDMNSGRVDAKFAQVYINSLKSTKLADPTKLDSITKYVELVDRQKALKEKEDSWFGLGKAPFDEIAKFRADVLQANGDGLITSTQVEKLLKDSSERFYANPVFRNALSQLAAQSSLYDTAEAQARAKADMYSSLIEKVIAGKNPNVAVTEVINEKLESELGVVADVDEYGFKLGEIRNGYEYIGNNEWQEK